MKKTSTKIALALVVVVFVFAIVSFLRENWSATGTPSMVETLLAKWALSRARGAESNVRNPIQPTQENLDEGRRLYEKECAFCHGSEGKGQGQTGIQFYPPVPSLVARTDEMSDGQIHSIISQGIRYTAMPSFAKELSDDQIWKVTLWVRHIARAVTSDK